MDRDLRIFFLFVGVPALLITAAGLLALVFGVSGLTVEMRSPGYGEQLERYERIVKNRMPARVRAFAKDGRADYVWAAGKVPWGTNASPRVRYGCYGATNATAIGWAKLEDGRVIGFRMEPFRYTDRSRMYLIAVGAVMVVLLFLTLFAGGWLLARAAKRAREELETKNSFLDMVSHELNTPLGSIVPLSSALAAGGIKSDEHRREALETISRESARMARMIDCLLTAVRLRNGKIRYACRRFALGEAVIAAVALVRMRYLDCTISVDGDDTAMALADRDRIEQVVINLVDNACRYAGGDTVEVTYGIDDAGRVQIAVADSGPGIPEALRRRMFERFYQASPGAAASRQGLGLGLHIVAGLVKGMDGEVAVAARDGGGSVFTVKLPGAAPAKGGEVEDG